MILYHPRKGPEINRPIETILGKFTKLSTKSPLGRLESTVSEAAWFGETETNSNLRGNIVRHRRRRWRFKASIFQAKGGVSAEVERCRGLRELPWRRGGKEWPVEWNDQLERGERNRWDTEDEEEGNRKRGWELFLFLFANHSNALFSKGILGIFLKFKARVSHVINLLKNEQNF